MERLEFIKKNTLEWREAKSPVIFDKDQVIVRPLAVSRCDLDLPIIRGETLFRAPFPIGHEYVGEVIETSEDLSLKFPVGQKVVVPFQISCGHCAHCETGKSKSCLTVPHASAYGLGKGGKDFGGALADSILVPYASSMLVPIQPKTNLVAIASISDNLVEAWKLAGIHLNVNPNQTLLVLGGSAASIGLYTVSLAKFMGAQKVVYMDTSLKRCELASTFGVDVMHVSQFPKRLDSSFDIVAEASGTKEGWMCGLKSLGIDGIFGSASIFFSNEFPIPYLDLYNNGGTIHIGRVSSREWIPKILHLIEEKGYDPSKIVTRTVNWSDAKEAYIEEETKLVIVR
jgi:threonine dehydrogenase-like Zn-dependent dehydrogenase